MLNYLLALFNGGDDTWPWFFRG